MSAERAQRGTIVLAYGLVFIAFTDNFSMLPTIGPYTQHLGGGALAMGIVVAAYSVTNLLLNVVGGIMLDRSGRRRLLLAGLVMAAVSMGLYAMATNVPSLLLARLIHGAAGGVLVPAVFTTIADLAPTRSSGQAMGRAGALIGSAAVVAPALAGIVRQVAGFEAVFLATASLLGVAAVLSAVRLPETLDLVRLKPVETHEPTSRAAYQAAGPAAAGVVRSAGAAAPDPGGGTASVEPAIIDKSGPGTAPPVSVSGRPSRTIWAAYWGIFAVTFSIGTLTAFLPEMAESMGHSAAVSGMLFTTFGLVAALIMVSPWSRLVDHRGVVRPLVLGLALVGVSVGLLMGAGSLAWLVAACAVFGCGFGLCFPAASGLVAASTAAGERGRAYGVFYAIFSLGVVTGAPLGGLGRSLISVIDNPFVPAFAPALLITALSLMAVVSFGRSSVCRGVSSLAG